MAIELLPPFVYNEVQSIVKINLKMYRAAMNHLIRKAIRFYTGICLALLFQVWAPVSYGENVQFQRISIREGLSQSSVFCIMQDRNGFLWFGTQDGLNKYNGMDFTVYKPDPDDPTTLSQNQIPDICEDKQGNIWVALTGGGVNRFDPRTGKFFRYPATPNGNTSFGGIFVQAIMCDRYGDIWAGSNNFGLEWLQRRTGQEVVVRFGLNTGLNSNFVNALIEDKEGYIWVGTPNDGLKRFDRRNREFVHFRNEPGNLDSLGSNNVTCLLEDRQGFIWVGTIAGLYRLDKEKRAFRAYLSDPAVPGSISGNNINALYEDSQGKLWVGTAISGLNLFDGSSKTFTTFRFNSSDVNSISSNLVASIMEDASGVLWVGTAAAGLNKYVRRSHFTLYRTVAGQANSLSHNSIYSIFEDRNGILWVGNIGLGLDRMDRRTGTFENFRNDPADPLSLSDNVVRHIYGDKKGRLWVGTQNAGLNLLDYPKRKFKRYAPEPGNPSSIAGRTIRWMLEDSAGRFWIATLAGLELFNPENGTFIHRQFIANDPRTPNNNGLAHIVESPTEPGVLWISTLNGGLNRLDVETGLFTYYVAAPNDPSRLSNNTVLCTYVDPKGVIWVCTYGGGLNKMERASNGTMKFTHYTEKNGLPNNCVYSLLVDGQGFFWLSTNKGLSCFNPETGETRNFSEMDGLQGDEFNAGAYHQNGSGELFFGGIAGLNAFFPDQFKSNSYIPPVVITGFQVFNKPTAIGPDSVLKQSLPYTNEIHMNYKQNMFSFTFAALDYTTPGKNKYAYKLENFDDEWNPTDASRRFAIYTNVKPGRYVFRVRGSNNDEVWNTEGASLRIVIDPPFWMTLWFHLMAAVLAISVILLFYRRRLHNVRLKTEMQTAHDAQMSIMPREDPMVSGLEVSGVCVPASEVGGDFFDYLWMNERRSKFGLVVGDVSGKAMRSAMTAVMTSGMISMEALAESSVKDILHRVNRPLYFKTGRNVFTALCMATIDTVSRELVFSNAGLSEPLLRSGDGVSALHTVGRKLPLGVRLDIEYVEQRFLLKPGEVLLFYTDGITEAKNSGGDFYGLARLKELLQASRPSGLTAREIKEMIIQDVRIFAQGADQYDDMTVVVVKVL